MQKEMMVALDQHLSCVTPVPAEMHKPFAANNQVN